MREPTARAFSEWAMFAMQWAWDPIGAFAPSFAMRVKHLRDCNATLFRNTALLKRLPTSELAKYLSRCWNSGGAMMYPQTSLYAVCVLHALRHFPRRQFLFLRYEDLMAMDHASILKLIGRFYGLYAGDDLVAAAEPSGRCQPAGGGRPKPAGGAKATGKRASTLRSDRRRTPSTYATISPEERILYNRSKLEIARDPEAYEALFGPYNELLSELVGHQGFRWDNPRKVMQSEQPRRPNALAVDFLLAEQWRTSSKGSRTPGRALAITDYSHPRPVESP